MDTVEGFEVANEPAGFFDDIWKFVSQGFYQTAYAGKEQRSVRNAPKRLTSSMTQSPYK